MSHVRTQLRDAIATALSGLPSLGTNVFKSRLYNLADGQIPAACVYFMKEDIENISPARVQPSLQRRDIRTAIVIAVKADDGEVEDTLDAVALEVEDKLFEDPTFNRLAVESSLLYAEKSIEEIDQPLGLMLLVFSSIVITKEGDASKSIQQ